MKTGEELAISNLRNKFTLSLTHDLEHHVWFLNLKSVLNPPEASVLRRTPSFVSVHMFLPLCKAWIKRHVRTRVGIDVINYASRCTKWKKIFPTVTKSSLKKEYQNNFEVEAHNSKFTKHVSDEQHPSSVANTNEPLVGVI